MKHYLPALGVYGFNRVEPVILAALVTGDPLLLIGRSGTGKTYLLNSLSEALGLEHRHYNASLISFDDLVGFPYPDNEHDGVRFLQTPATVWGAESVLVDEISRCKPEHQNRLFSLVHERRIQGIALERLRYRWAAMNPCGTDDETETYSGSEPLDPALADRFALIVSATDWDQLPVADRRRIAAPSGEGLRADDGGVLRGKVDAWRTEFEERVASCPQEIVEYAVAAVTTLGSHNVRLSPRRARLLTRSLLAAEIVNDGRSESLFETILRASIPQKAWGVQVEPGVITLTHRVAWDTTMVPEERRWIHDFHLESRLGAKLTILLDKCTDPDAGTQVVSELLSRQHPARAAAFAFAVYPAAVSGLTPIGSEGINDLGKLAVPILDVRGEMRWQEARSQSNTTHPELVRFLKVIGKLRGARRKRAEQFFNYCLVANVSVPDPQALEEELHVCIEVLKGRKERPAA